MIKTSIRDLVPALGDLANKGRIILGDPAQDKERRLGVMSVQQVQGLYRILSKTRLEIAPILSVYQFFKSTDVEIVLNQYSEYVC